MIDESRGHASATLLEASKQSIDLDPAIRSLWPGARLVGRAFVVQGSGGDNLALHRAVVAAPSGSVIVADLAAAPHGHWGEVLGVAAMVRGIQGLLIDGGARDAAELQILGFPVFSRNNAIRGTRKDFPGVFGRPVSVGGRKIADGDLIVGDVDGVVALPAADVTRILDAADVRVEEEDAFFDRLRRGESTLDLYEFGREYREARAQ